jgi:uncharacterized protein YaaW (UPF0174 family)
MLIFLTDAVAVACLVQALGTALTTVLGALGWILTAVLVTYTIAACSYSIRALAHNVYVPGGCDL